MKATILTAAVLVTAGMSSAANLTITPASPNITINTVDGVVGDSAPAFGSSSISANGNSGGESFNGKVQINLSPNDLFGRTITFGEIADFSYWTKKTTTGPTPVDWYVEIYTRADGMDDDSWYGRRINFEPYFSDNYSAPDGTWNQWSTASGTNRLRAFDANRGASGPVFGTYTDPFLSDLTSGPVDWSDSSSAYETGDFDYRDEEVFFLAISTGSGWAGDFTGQLDGFEISLNDASGSTASVNFEAVPEPTAALAGVSLLSLVGLRRRAKAQIA